MNCYCSFLDNNPILYAIKSMDSPMGLWTALRKRRMSSFFFFSSTYYIIFIPLSELLKKREGAIFIVHSALLVYYTAELKAWEMKYGVTYHHHQVLLLDPHLVLWALMLYLSISTSTSKHSNFVIESQIFSESHQKRNLIFGPFIILSGTFLLMDIHKTYF